MRRKPGDPKICRVCKADGPFWKGSALCKPCKSTEIKASRDKRRQLGMLPLQTLHHRRARLEVLTRYSNGQSPFCSCCKENRIEFLGLDHINGGGFKHRKALRFAKTNIYLHLKNLGFPEGYRVLCHNCNQALGLYGYCPHQKRRTTDEWMAVMADQYLPIPSHSKVIKVGRSTKTVQEWATDSGRKADTILHRLRRGLRPKEAVFGPMRRSSSI